MAASGEHGGNSDDEKNTALFAFTSKNLRFNSEDDIIEKYSTVYQVLKLILFPINIFWLIHIFTQTDLTPTLAFLHNVPIPFGNIGTMIDDFAFLEKRNQREKPEDIEFEQVLSLAKFLYMNSVQVLIFLFISSKVDSLHRRLCSEQRINVFISVFDKEKSRKSKTSSLSFWIDFWNWA